MALENFQKGIKRPNMPFEKFSGFERLNIPQEKFPKGIKRPNMPLEYFQKGN